jgi:hypothetical protein
VECPADNRTKSHRGGHLLRVLRAIEVDEVNHVMSHYPELALDPNFVATKQRRPYRFEGNRLIFSGKPAPEDDDQTVDRWMIVWEKQPK